MKRREFLVLSAASVGGVLVYSLDRNVSIVSAQTGAASGDKIRIPCVFLPKTKLCCRGGAIADFSQ